jgi:hypothetical protein
MGVSWPWERNVTSVFRDSCADMKLDQYWLCRGWWWAESTSESWGWVYVSTDEQNKELERKTELNTHSHLMWCICRTKWNIKGAFLFLGCKYQWEVRLLQLCGDRITVCISGRYVLDWIYLTLRSYGISHSHSYGIVCEHWFGARSLRRVAYLGSAEQLLIFAARPCTL